jgi:hypothetical protein
MSQNDPLIDRTRVPDLEVLGLQQALNARVRAGALSGPLLPENGVLDEATRNKQREQEACDTIALASLEPERPGNLAEWEAARAADEALLQQLSQELELIPDTPYLNFDHKAPSVARLQQLVEQFEAKWNPADEVQDRVQALLGEFPAPGSLLLPDGGFNYAALQAALARVQQAEAAHLSSGQPSDHDINALLRSFRQHVAWALVSPGTTTPQPPPLPLKKKTAAALPGSPAPASVQPSGVHEEVTDSFAPNPHWDRMGREMDTWGPEQRAQLIREGLAQTPPAENVPRLVHSLLRTHPPTVQPDWLACLDGYACKTLSKDTQCLSNFPPRLRLALIKHHATHAAGDLALAQQALAGACAVSLIQEHPRAILDILASASPEAQGPLILHVLAQLPDQRLQSMGKETLHVLSKRLSVSEGADQRRVLARLVRLMGAR